MLSVIPMTSSPARVISLSRRGEIGNMPLTRDFRETVMARVKSDPAFRGELIVEATNAFLMDETRKRDWLVRHPQ